MSLGKKVATELLSVVREAIDAVNQERAPYLQLHKLNRLEVQLRAEITPSRFVSHSRQVKAKKRAARNEETAEIRVAVFARAGGLCEMCHQAPATELHHVFGRGHGRPKQSERNCLALCHGCHHLFTINRPTAESCWADARDILLRLGFKSEAAEAERHRSWHWARGSTNKRAGRAA